MADTTTLIVPMNVAALCVGLPDSQSGSGRGGPAMTHAPAADFSALPYLQNGSVRNRGPYLATAVLANGEAFQGTVPLLAGIHLHWSLPDGLTHGTRAGADAPVSFPAVPNRWLVTRIVQGTLPQDGPPTRLRSWIVESDRLSVTATAPPGLAQPTVPTTPERGQNFRFLGRSFDLDGWQEVGGTVERLAPLTAVGYGEPGFAALYPESSTVFGFLDVLDDIPDFDPGRGRISYQVSGWYSAPADDPLHNGGLDPASNPYRWSYTGGPAPTATVCAGVADGIPWDPQHSFLTQPQNPLTAALAPSTPEALSALLANVLAASDDAAPDVEQLLNALQFGLLTADGTGSLDAFEEDVHRAGFTALHGGTRWSVRVVDRSDAASGGEVTLPEPLGADLDALNSLQQRLDAASAALRSARSRLFTDWCKYLLVAYQSEQVPPELVAALGQVQLYLDAEITGLGLRTGAIAELTAQVGTASAALRDSLPAGVALDGEPTATRFHQPADPVLLLSGPDIVPSARYGGDGLGTPDGSLPCRLDTHVVTALALPAGAVPGSGAVTLDASALPAPAALPAPVPPAALALLREALLLSAATQPCVADALRRQGGADNPAVIDGPATLALLSADSAAFRAGTAPAKAVYAGLAPAPLLFADWTGTPWLPVTLQYEVELQPVQFVDPRLPQLTTGGIPYPPDFLTGQFRLDAEGVDLVYQGSSLPANLQLYSGSVTLSPRGTVDLIGEIRRFEASAGADDPELTAVLTLLGTLPLLSQALTGTTEAMLMRGLTLQLPIADPLASPPGAQFAAAVAAAVGRDRLSPLPENSFNPLRTGAFRVTRLRLVDAFGRYRDHTAPDCVVARSVIPPTTLPTPAGTAFLPPRITQPARLRFRWLSAADAEVESNSHPATTPVCGWLLLDNVDDAVALYDADGTALGALTAGADGVSTLWTPAPGGAFPPDASLDDVLAPAQPQLRAAATGLYGEGDTGYLGPFLAAVRSALVTVLPDRFRQDVTTAVLVGRPLVLAQARLSLETFGAIATDQSWNGFAATVLRDLPPDDLGLGGVRFPVALGSPARLDDSLVGFWLGPGGHVDYSTFYTPAAGPGRGPVRRPAADTVTLTPSGDAGAVTVTLLLDPRGSVHATTGVLPTASLSVPPDQYASAAAALSVTFATHPLLSGSNTDTLRLPVPRSAAGSWDFVTATADSWATAPTADSGADGATSAYTPQRLLDGWLRLRAFEPSAGTQSPRFE